MLACVADHVIAEMVFSDSNDFHSSNPTLSKLNAECALPALGLPSCATGAKLRGKTGFVGLCCFCWVPRKPQTKKLGCFAFLARFCGGFFCKLATNYCDANVAIFRFLLIFVTCACRIKPYPHRAMFGCSFFGSDLFNVTDIYRMLSR